MKENPIYRDLDLTFKPHPLTGDLSPKVNVEAVRRALLTAFYMEKYDVPFDNSNTSSLNQYLFEPSGQATVLAMNKAVEWIFRSLEPRTKLIKSEITESQDGKGYNISVWYTIVSLNTNDSFTFYATRAR